MSEAGTKHWPIRDVDGVHHVLFASGGANEHWIECQSEAEARAIADLPVLFGILSDVDEDAEEQIDQVVSDRELSQRITRTAEALLCEPSSPTSRHITRIADKLRRRAAK